MERLFVLCFFFFKKKKNAETYIYLYIFHIFYIYFIFDASSLHDLSVCVIWCKGCCCSVRKRESWGDIFSSTVNKSWFSAQGMMTKLLFAYEIRDGGNC